MFKALLKKQLTELIMVYFPQRGRSRKKDKDAAAEVRKRNFSVGMVVLFAFLWLMMSIAFVGMAELFAGTFIPAGLDWLYFAMLGMLALFLSVFGSVFNTYSTLFHAKDNELLLSMPIKPSMILTVRMISVYTSGIMWSAMAWIPAILVYCMRGNPSSASVVFSILILFLISMLGTVLSCMLGWIVALVSGRLKNKTFVTVLLSFVLIGAYYFIYFRLNSFLQCVAQNGEQISKSIQKWVYPVYQLGLAATGGGVPMLIFSAICIAAAALCIVILSRTFIRIVTSNKGTTKKVYKEREAKQSSVAVALVKKEVSRLFASATYMLNSGLGLVLMVGITILVIVKRADIVALFDGADEINAMILHRILPVVATAGVFTISSMCAFTAPSISLEGKNLWILRTSPVSAYDVLTAKVGFHVILTALPCALLTVTLGVALQTDVITILLMLVATLLFVWLNAVAGLALNLKKPMLDWTNEAVPVKQSMPVAIVMFGGMIVGLAVGGGYFFLAALIPAWAYLIICAALTAGGAALITHWLKTKGARIFDNL